MRLRFYLPAVLWLALTGCREESVSYYQVPKESDPQLTANAAAESTPPMNDSVPGDSGPALAWTAPSDWKQKPLGSTRRGSYAVTAKGTEADLSITAFPGDVGGELANVNRWRGQVQLPALSQDQLEGTLERTESNGLKLTIVDFASTSPSAGQRIIGAIIPVRGSTWFIKLMGPDQAVEEKKAEFLSFLRTVKLQ